jgi:hypothetical protein
MQNCSVVRKCTCPISVRIGSAGNADLYRFVAKARRMSWRLADFFGELVRGIPVVGNHAGRITDGCRHFVDAVQICFWPDSLCVPLQGAE